MIAVSTFDMNKQFIASNAMSNNNNNSYDKQ